MRLTAGTVAPAFATSDHLGHPIELNGARQNAVLLSFLPPARSAIFGSTSSPRRNRCWPNSDWR